MLLHFWELYAIKQFHVLSIAKIGKNVSFKAKSLLSADFNKDVKFKLNFQIKFIFV